MFHFSSLEPLHSFQKSSSEFVSYCTCNFWIFQSWNIIQYVTYAYHNWDSPPLYLLIVGDVDDVPTGDMGGYVSDHYYAVVDGDDFLPDIYVTCEACKGTRYSRETLEIRYRGRSIADVLAMRVEEAMSFFQNFPKVRQLLRAINDVGLSYVELGQSSTTLSGGEAQRVKLASELGKTATGHTLYVLDEPTTGLHFADIHKLLNVLNRLADFGNTIIIIEHNMDVIKCADYIVDLGPEGGDDGGRVVACGTPEKIASNKGSHTGKILKKYLS